MFDIDHELSLDEFGKALNLPSVGAGRAPDTFNPEPFWKVITGKESYYTKGTKASSIQNPCFRYAQKAFAYTLFGRGDNPGVVSIRELYFLYCMSEHKQFNVAAFMEDHLRKVSRAKAETIYVGGIITAFVDGLGYGRELRDVPSLAPGVVKIDMVALIK